MQRAARPVPHACDYLRPGACRAAREAATVVLLDSRTSSPPDIGPVPHHGTRCVSLLVTRHNEAPYTYSTRARPSPNLPLSRKAYRTAAYSGWLNQRPRIESVFLPSPARHLLHGRRRGTSRSAAGSAQAKPRAACSTHNPPAHHRGGHKRRREHAGRSRGRRRGRQRASDGRKRRHE